jgi:hypothetical protein
MKKFIEKFNIDRNLKRLTTIQKPAKYTKFDDIILKMENMSQQMDILYLPETDKGNKYLLNIIDLYSKKADFEPLKSITQDEIIKALEAIYKRKILKIPYYLMSSDNGGEFGQKIIKWFKDKETGYKKSMAYKHSQNAVIEAFNRNIGEILNLYMSNEEIKKGVIFKNWDLIIPELRILLNEDKEPKNINIVKDEKKFNEDYKEPKFKLNDLVYYKSQIPLNALFQPQNTKKFRAGDIRFNQPRKIINIFYYPRGIIKYKLEGIDKTVYDENDLLKVNEENIKYIVEKIISKKMINRRVYYEIKWKDYKETTLEPRTNLIKDGLQEYIKEFEKLNKK